MIAGILLITWSLFLRGNEVRLAVLVLVLGTLFARVIFEAAIVAFRTYERLGEIRDALDGDRTRQRQAPTA